MQEIYWGDNSTLDEDEEEVYEPIEYITEDREELDKTLNTIGNLYIANALTYIAIIIVMLIVDIPIFIDSSLSFTDVLWDIINPTYLYAPLILYAAVLTTPFVLFSRAIKYKHCVYEETEELEEEFEKYPYIQIMILSVIFCILILPTVIMTKIGVYEPLQERSRS